MPLLPPGATKGRQVYDAAQDLYRRRNSDDLLFLVLFLIDQYVQRVALLPKQEPDLLGIYKMMRYCAGPIAACVTDPQCSKALSSLSSAGLNDQARQFPLAARYCPKPAACSIFSNAHGRCPRTEPS